MLRRDKQVRTQIHQLVDACLFAFGFWLTYYIRSHAVVVQQFSLVEIPPFRDFAWLLVVIIPAAPLVLEAQGYYERSITGSRLGTTWASFKACVITGVGLILLLFLGKAPFSRIVAVQFGVTCFVLMSLKEELLRGLFQTKLAREQRKRYFVLIGTSDETTKMKQELRFKSPDIIVLAELDLNTAPVERLAEVLHEHSVNGAIISAKHSYFDKVEAAIRTCEVEGVEAWLVADFFKTQISRTSFDEFSGRPVMVFRTTPEASWQSVVKQVIDFIGALILLFFAAPFMLAAALAIKRTSPGPILFRQLRSGLNGRPFTILKFRTMVTDAEQRKHELAAMNEMSGPVFKMTGDPRITAVGKILRKWSIDELPQLFNVIRGEMSLVGPRPLPVDEVKRFNDVAHRRRLSVKPGLTCLWQVSGRNEVTDFNDWVRLDLQYIDNWSIWLDLKILFQTVPVVIAGTGAK